MEVNGKSESSEEAASRAKASKSRPRLADALIGVDFSSMPAMDIYGSKFKEMAKAKEKADEEVAKTLYDFAPKLKRTHDVEGCSAEEQQKLAVTSGQTKQDSIDKDSVSPSKVAKPMPQSKATKKILREIDQIKADALADAQSSEEINDGLLDENEDLLSDDVVCVDQEKELEFKRSITVRVADYKSNIKKYTMLKSDSFSKIFNDLAREHNVAQEQVMLTFNDVFIKIYDTPMSIGLRIGDFVEFCKLSKPVIAPLTEMDKANRVTLKVQSATSKKRIEITMNKVDPISRLMEEYCKISGLNLAKLAFKFDDEDLDPNSTPNELDLEDGYCIDAIEH